MTWRHWLVVAFAVTVFVVLFLAIWSLFGAVCQVYLAEFCEAL